MFHIIKPLVSSFCFICRDYHFFPHRLKPEIIHLAIYMLRLLIRIPPKTGNTGFPSCIRFHLGDFAKPRSSNTVIMSQQSKKTSSWMKQIFSISCNTAFALSVLCSLFVKAAQVTIASSHWNFLQHCCGFFS